MKHTSTESDEKLSLTSNLNIDFNNVGGMAMGTVIIGLLLYNYLQEDHTVKCEVRNNAQLKQCFDVYDRVSDKTTTPKLEVTFTPQ